MKFREEMDKPDFAFEFTGENEELLFTAYGKSEANDDCFLLTTPLYENPNNLAMYYMETMDDVLRFLYDVWEISEEEIDNALFAVEASLDAESGGEYEAEEDSPFVPGKMDEEAEFGG